MEEKGEGFTGIIIKDTWTTTWGGGNGGGWKQEREVGRAGGKVRKLYLNNN